MTAGLKTLDRLRAPGDGHGACRVALAVPLDELDEPGALLVGDGQGGNAEDLAVLGEDQPTWPGRCRRAPSGDLEGLGHSRTRPAVTSAIQRKPSSFISCAQPSPVGGASAAVRSIGWYGAGIPATSVPQACDGPSEPGGGALVGEPLPSRVGWLARGQRHGGSRSGCRSMVDTDRSAAQLEPCPFATGGELDAPSVGCGFDDGETAPAGVFVAGLADNG